MPSQRLLPEWIQVIESRLMVHINCLMAKYFSQSSERLTWVSPDDVFNETILRMLKVEQNGTKINAPLSYSKKVAESYIIQVKKKECANKKNEYREDIGYKQGSKKAINDQRLSQLLGDFRQKYPEKHKILILRDFKQLSYQEISMLLSQKSDQRSCEATRQRYCRARKDFIAFARKELGLDP